MTSKVRVSSTFYTSDRPQSTYIDHLDIYGRHDLQRLVYLQVYEEIIYITTCRHEGHACRICIVYRSNLGNIQSLLRGTTVNRTYVTLKNLYISLFLLAIFGPVYYGPP